MSSLYQEILQRTDKVHMKKVFFLFWFILAYPLLSQETEGLYPNPEPFSLDASSAIYCIELLRSTPFIEVKEENGTSSIVKVEKVWSLYLKNDEIYPPGHIRRYDIIVNEKPMDWNNSYIEYGGEMINLQLLFLYRNQHPPEGLAYKSQH